MVGNAVSVRPAVRHLEARQRTIKSKLGGQSRGPEHGSITLTIEFNGCLCNAVRNSMSTLISQKVVPEIMRR